MKKQCSIILYFYLSCCFILLSTTIISQNNYLPFTINSCTKPFYHGVASGDPLADRVILWTRVTPDAIYDSIPVNWRICTDTAMLTIINQGVMYAKQEKDFTVKIDATNLNANTYYYYDFYSLGNYSAKGRTKTLPQQTIDSIRLAVVSCAYYTDGYFNVYNVLAKKNDVDAVICLGDYVYEAQKPGTIAGRDSMLYEPVSLDDYRLRYSLYHLDNDLIAAHQQYPWICVWDDHEFAENANIKGSSNHDTLVEGNWELRKWSARKAYEEWLPVRLPDVADSLRIYRSFVFGDLLKLHMLDTRVEGRSEQVPANSPLINDSTRKIISDKQFNWLTTELKTSTAKWNVIGQQVMMAPVKIGTTPINNDQWDGYSWQRKQLFDSIISNAIQNIVVLTGDIHSSWASDLPYTNYNATTGSGAVGVEFVTPSVTSGSLNNTAGIPFILSQNPHVKYIDAVKHRYYILDINNQRAQANWYYVNTVSIPSDDYAFGTAYSTLDGERHINGPVAESLSLKIFPPTLPTCNDGLTNINNANNLIVTGAFPNPFNNTVSLQFVSMENKTIIISIKNIAGQIIDEKRIDIQKGINNIRYTLSENISDGTYIFNFISKENTTAFYKLIRKGL